MQESSRNHTPKESCILIDRSVHFLENSGSKLDIDPTQKNRVSPSFFSTLQKTTWTCLVEGVVEYCRIVYDILSPVYKILVLCSDEVVSDINSFQNESQNISSVLKGFGEIGPAAKNAEYHGITSVYLSLGVAQATQELLKTVKEETGKCLKRLIVITTIGDENDAKSISNWVWDIQNQYDKSNLCHLDLVIVNVSNASNKYLNKVTSKISHEKRHVSPQLDVTTVTFKSSHCSNKIALLVRKHFNLRSTIITGIPMKEEQNAGTSANYDVEIIHSAAAHHDGDWVHTNANGTKKDLSSKSAVTLKWCTPKANMVQELLPCVGAYRISPAEVNSRPAACLIMFLLQGRTVMLEEPKKSGNKILTHMLSSHGGEVYIHDLLTGRCPLEDPPSISEGFGGRVTDYRVNDFGKFMKGNKLVPYNKTSNVSEGPNLQAISRLERYSKHWPMVISDTLIFNMQTNLEPLLQLLLKPSLTDEDVKECKKVIFKLQGMESRNDSLPLPIVTLKGKGSKKEEQYKQVWSELDTFIEGASVTSAMHKKVLDCLRGIQQASLPDSKPVDDAKSSESDKDKAWTEVERYQQTTDREKKAVNEAPSDPRKRRKISENAGIRQTEAQPLNVKKSPRPEEKSPTAKRVATTRVHATNVTSMIQAKSSLLSIWSDHMNLTASRLHGEFIGRKLSINGKYELYQKEVEQDR